MISLAVGAKRHWQPKKSKNTDEVVKVEQHVCVKKYIPFRMNHREK